MLRRNCWYFCGAVALLLLWLGLAAWQRHEYTHEVFEAKRSIQRQAETFHGVLVGSMRSHRRVSPLFDSMVQGSLESMAGSVGILAVGVAEEQPGGISRLLLSAGEHTLLAPGAPPDPLAPRFEQRFELNPREGHADVGGMGPGGGGGFGLGGGGGRGWGRAAGTDSAESVFQIGQTYTTILVLDGSETAAQLDRARRLRILVVLAGGGILLLISVAWLMTVRLVESRSEARLLASEAEHLQEMSQAAAGLAHETRNPLGLVRGWTQRLAQSQGASDEQRRQAGAVIEECDRVTARINQFLSFARPCAPSLEQVDLEPLLEELAVILQPDLEGKGLRAEIHVETRPAMARVDREMFRQALFNIVSNAIEFSPQGGVIEIRLAPGNDGTPRVEIADSGPGVPPENVESLFSPYFTTRSTGTGLGLAIVRRIARAHGWRVGFRPRPGGGSVFWMEGEDGR